jgi:predicted NodU family carbamoyl transferase
MRTLVISALLRDSAACIVEHTVVHAAALEERFSRVKRQGGFPIAAIAYCLEESGVESTTEIDAIVCHEPTVRTPGHLDAAVYAAMPDFNGEIRYTRDPFPVVGSAAPEIALGPSYSSEEIREILDRFDLPYERLKHDDVIQRIARVVVDGKRVGTLQGRMEFGMETIGNRSILSMHHGPSRVPALAGTFVHAVSAALTALGEAALHYEPFDTDEEPIVCSPLDAYRCMKRAALDCIVMEDVLVWRHEQPS